MADISKMAIGEALMTEIMYGANLSFRQLNKYLEFMLDIGFLEKRRDNGRQVYKATEKSLDFLQCYSEITELLNSEEKKESRNGNNLRPMHT